MNDIFTAILDIVKTGQDLVLARIVNSKGSTPRTSGARMVVRRDRSISGTIGGGLVEASAIKAAMDVFETGCSALFEMDLSSEALAETEMICGGRLQILCEYIPSDKHTISLFESIVQTEQKLQTRLLCTEFDENKECLTVSRRLLLKNGKDIQAFAVNPEIHHDILRMIKNAIGSAILVIEGRNYCIDVLESRHTVFIFGAGHVAKEVSALAMNVGFHAIVLDDRIEFANKKRFPFPAEIAVLDSFENCFRDREVYDHSYIVIVTRGHLHDKTVLAQSLQTQAGYIGMIGSRRKRDSIYQALLQEGFTDHDLARVHSP
ncbi:MAG: dehydrogenase, partial [Desulfobacterium sp.]|nr:dehydrogenase [Desulfobacterium sp.]